MHPIDALKDLAKQARNENLLSELEAIDSNEAYLQYIHGKETPFSLALQAYIRDFGDRNMEELKLESKTFRTDPVLLVRCILQYARESSDTAADREASNAAPPRLTGPAAFFAKRAAVGIRNRERSRLHRGRLYGMMRSLVLQMGQNLYAEHRIQSPDDVFWLYCSELEAAASDGSMDLRRIISERKRQYEGFSRLPAFSRLIFSGKVIDKAPKDSRKMSYSRTESFFYGIPCSPGCFTGEVLIVEQPSPVLDTKGKILVAKMTDPGWVFLIAQAGAILSEKGSLLSHTAIISRELGKPSVVGIDHITEYLKTGDMVQVDGDSGVVIVISGSDNRILQLPENHLTERKTL